MISIITRRHHELSATLEDDLGRYRHEVFIQQLGWQLNSTHARPQREFDQFDHADARHILALDAEHQVCGCARLLPTTQPYLLAQVFGFLCDHQPREAATPGRCRVLPRARWRKAPYRCASGGTA